MITLDAFLVFLVAASLPATFIWIVSRVWVEPEYREVCHAAETPAETPPTPRLVTKAA